MISGNYMLTIAIAVPVSCFMNKQSCDASASAFRMQTGKSLKMQGVVQTSEAHAFMHCMHVTFKPYS